MYDLYDYITLYFLNLFHKVNYTGLCHFYHSLILFFYNNLSMCSIIGEGYAICCLPAHVAPMKMIVGSRFCFGFVLDCVLLVVLDVKFDVSSNMALKLFVIS